EIAKGMKAKFHDIRKQIPDGVKIAGWYDQSDLIIASQHNPRDAILIGMVLAAFVLLIFLRDWKVTLIAILTVPAVLAATIVLLYVLKMSFNIMTLGGMAAAVGLIVDDAIVMVEHIVRRVRGMREGDPRSRVLSAASEFTNPLAASSRSKALAPDLCRPWTKAVSYWITFRRPGLRSPKLTASCARWNPFCRKRRKCRLIRAAPDCSWAAASLKRIRATFLFG